MSLCKDDETRRGGRREENEWRGKNGYDSYLPLGWTLVPLSLRLIGTWAKVLLP